MSLTQFQLLRRLVNEYNMGKGGVASAGSVSTVVDTSVFGGQRSGSMFPNGSPVRILIDGGETAKSWKSAINPSTGTLTVNPDFDDAADADTQYVISNIVDDIDRLIEAQNRCLEHRMTYRAKTPMTYVPDGDIMAPSADIATFWTSNDASAAYVSLAMPETLGKRVLQATLTDDDGSLLSQVFSATAGDTWDVLTYIRVVSAADVFFDVLDVTNSTTITVDYSEGTGSTDSFAFVEQRGTFVIPTGCSQIRVQLRAAGNGEIAQMARCIMAPTNATEYTTQSHVISNDDITGYFVGTNFAPINYEGVQYDDRGWGTVIQWPYHPGFPVYYEEVLSYPPLSSDSDSTDAPEEALLLGTAIEVYQTLVSSEMYPQKRNTYTAELARLQKLWDDQRLSRLRASRKVVIRRPMATRTYA